MAKNRIVCSCIKKPEEDTHKKAQIYTQKYIYIHTGASLVTQLVKNLPAMRETWVRSLGWEDPLEDSMKTHSSVLAWNISIDREAWQLYSPWSPKESDKAE